MLFSAVEVFQSPQVDLIDCREQQVEIVSGHCWWKYHFQSQVDPTGVPFNGLEQLWALIYEQVTATRLRHPRFDLALTSVTRVRSATIRAIFGYSQAYAPMVNACFFCL